MTLNEFNRKLNTVGLRCYAKDLKFYVVPKAVKMRDTNPKTALVTIDRNRHWRVNGYTSSLEKVIKDVLAFASTPNEQKLDTANMPNVTDKQVKALIKLGAYVVNTYHLGYPPVVVTLKDSEFNAAMEIYKRYNNHTLHNLKRTSVHTQYLFHELIKGKKCADHDNELTDIDAEASMHY